MKTLALALSMAMGLAFAANGTAEACGPGGYGSYGSYNSYNTGFSGYGSYGSYGSAYNSYPSYGSYAPNYRTSYAPVRPYINPVQYGGGYNQFNNGYRW